MSKNDPRTIKAATSENAKVNAELKDIVEADVMPITSSKPVGSNPQALTRTGQISIPPTERGSATIPEIEP